MTLRFCLALTALASLVSGVVDPASSALAQESGGGSFPYFAYVTGSDVHLRSGPGMQYYPTERLPQGVEVEVYRADPGGWLAVRPTQNSFSWVLARYVRLAGENQGIIVGDGVVARTGSRLSDVRDVIQVQLHYGETVTIVGVREFGEGRSREAWVQIAPPAGEFRWVSERDVRRAPAVVAQAAPAKAAPPRSASNKRPAARPAAEEAAEDDEDESADESAAIAEVDYEAEAVEESTPRPKSEKSEVASSGGWKTSSGPPPRKKPREPVVRADFREDDSALRDERDAPATRTARDEADDEPRRLSESRGNDKPTAKSRSFDDALAEDVAPQRRLKRDALADEADRLASLQADVAREAARETAEWDFRDLADEAADLAERGEQGFVRKRARELLEQIERFESIRDRRAQLAPETSRREETAQRERPPIADDLPPPTRSRDGIRRASYEEPAQETAYPVKAARYDDQPVTEPAPQLPSSARASSSALTASSAATARLPAPQLPTPTESADDPRFDATGVLTPIVATKVGDPTYALLDERGEINAFVAPGPGVSLRRCVGERIGVVGSTNVLPQLGNKTLVVVRRAAALAP